jgi:hypothetical protein
LDVQLPATYEAAVDQALAKRHATGWISILVAAGAVLLMTLGWRLGARRTVAVSLFCAALGTAGWLGYGSLHGDTRFLHAWEITHYYLGPKYFTELGHAGLYDALARHEFEQGRGSILQHAGIRDLADNSTHQGAVYDAVSQYRPDTFTASRWQAFGRDADRIRRLLVYRHFHSILGDHGYNGTPTLTWLLHHLTNLVPAGVRAFRALAVIDLLCLLFGLISIWWAFGPRAGGLAFVVAGLCPYWDISFTGGSIGRYLWFLSLCSGMALTQRKQFFAGALLVTLSGCLRLFPLVFLFFPAVEFFEHLFRGTLEPRHRSAFCGVATALVCALLLPLVSFGPGIFVDFFHNTRIHGVLPPANHLGLGVICSRGLGASVLDFSLDVSKQLVARRLLWALGVAGGLLVALTLYRRQSREKLWERIPLAAPLLFATLPLSSYDYLWCVVLVPFAAEARSRTAMIGALLVVAGVCAQAFADVGLGHTVMSVVFLCFIAAFFLDLLRRDGPAQPISADATSP